jgi:hypothetical protein
MLSESVDLREHPIGDLKNRYLDLVKARGFDVPLATTVLGRL